MRFSAPFAVALVVSLIVPRSVAESARPSVERTEFHPALAPFDIDPAALPANLYLARTRGSMPDVSGVAVHGRRGNTFLVSAKPGSLDELSRRGCSIYPLSAPPLRSRAGRVWTEIDEPDPFIQAMVDEVEWERIEEIVQYLVGFETRYSFARNNRDISQSLAGRFEALGYEPELQEFSYQNKKLWNVVATHAGTVAPDSFFIIGAHFDSISERPARAAPGADDNGTGVAAVLTAAEILARHEFEYSVRFICFAAEEQLMMGSGAYARRAWQEDLPIMGMLNFDMLGWWKDGVRRDLEIETNVASRWLAGAIVNAADLYTEAPYRLHVYDGAWWGDHASFWMYGFPAVNHEESWDWNDPDFNPFYHTTDDLPEHLHHEFTVDNVKVAVASLATLARPVPPVVPVAFDIRPGSDVAPFNPKSRGVVPAVIYGDGQMHMQDIDTASLRVGPAAPVATRLCDASGDGVMDLWMKLPADAIAAAIGPAAKQDRITLRLTGAMTDGTRIEGEDVVTIVGNTGGPVLADGSPDVTRLVGAVPNPFNPVTRIRFTLARETHVRVTIYDARGHLLERLVDGVRPAGSNHAVWNAHGHSSGIYFCRFEADVLRETRKLVLLK